VREREMEREREMVQGSFWISVGKAQQQID